MITAEQIPKEVWKAAWDGYVNSGCTMAEAVAAAINAWPGIEVKPTHEGYPAWPHIILPIQEQEPKS